MIGADAIRFKEELLGRDTRQLGRLLGDTIRAQQGDQVFDWIESIRMEFKVFFAKLPAREGAC